jgi:LacI family transcriptional regulator
MKEDNPKFPLKNLLLSEEKLIIVQQDEAAKEAPLMVQEAIKYGWKLLHVSSRPVLPAGLKISGAIVKDGLNQPLVQELIREHIPYVRVGIFPYFYATGMPSVSVDLPECGRMAAGHFADLGFKNVGFIGNDPWADSKEMFLKFKNRSEALGCKCHLHQLRSSRLSPPGMDRVEWVAHENQRMVEWIKTLSKPLGLLAYHDHFASRISLYFHSSGIRIPEDVAIISVGNHEFKCETSLVPLSSIEHDWKGLWKVSFNMLNEMILGTSAVRDTVYVPPKVVVERKSTDVLPVNDQEVALALKYIWENFFKPINTGDVVSKLKISRSTLERRFKTCLGRTINDELRRKRIEVAERLLVNTNQSVSDIAEQVGFPSRNHFYKVFEDVYHCTPAKYRRQNQKVGLE